LGGGGEVEIKDFEVTKMQHINSDKNAPWNKPQVGPKGFDYREGEIDAISKSSLNLRLPWPPSGNRQTRHTKNGGHYLPAAIVAYRGQVARLLADQGWGSFGTRKPLVGPLALSIVCAPDSRRATDLDNRLKCLLDALVHGGLLEDDSNRVIRRLQWEWLEPVKGGDVWLEVSQCNG
jgi:crossover junction endodeoxyribonuclease RusA